LKLEEERDTREKIRATLANQEEEL